MAFKDVADLSADTTVSIGGFNKKLKKDNPTKIEGYYLGSKQVADAKKKSGVSFIYILQTPKGNVGVWGKTDMDNKMKAVRPGTMIEISFDKMVSTPNGDMYKYRVRFDEENTIEVQTPEPQSCQAASDSDDDETYAATTAEVTEDEVDDEDAQQAAQLAILERQAKVKALLSKNKKA